MKTLVISTSSPQVAVAILDRATVLAHSEEHAPRQAEAALFGALQRTFEEAGTSLTEIQGIVADVGPGSFTGVRVGVTVVKTLAWSQGMKVAGIPSFELIAEGAVAVPSRREMYLLRDKAAGSPKEVTGEEAIRAGAVGYGQAFSLPLYPDPRRAALSIGQLKWIAPEELLPWYILEPGISKPKTPYPRVSE